MKHPGALGDLTAEGAAILTAPIEVLAGPHRLVHWVVDNALRSAA